MPFFFFLPQQSLQRHGVVHDPEKKQVTTYWSQNWLFFLLTWSLGCNWLVDVIFREAKGVENNCPLCLFQLKPRPKRSLASRLSGHKPKKKRQAKTSNSDESSIPHISQSETTSNPQLIGQLQSFSSESFKTLNADIPETPQSLRSSDLEPIKSECAVSKSKSIYFELNNAANPVVHLLEPLLL